MKTAKANEQLFKTMKTILKNINLGLIRVHWRRCSAVSHCRGVPSLPWPQAERRILLSSQFATRTRNLGFSCT